MSFAAGGETNDMELATTRCIIAPLSPSRVFALVRFLRFSPALNQQIQLLLNRFISLFSSFSLCLAAVSLFSAKYCLRFSFQVSRS